MRAFGLAEDTRRVAPAEAPAEAGMAELMVDLYRHFQAPLTHETLWGWHRMLMAGRRDLRDIGAYRTLEEPMQVVSGAIYAPRVHFEAPPAQQVYGEMDRFVAWLDRSAPTGERPLPGLTSAGIAGQGARASLPGGTGGLRRGLGCRKLYRHHPHFTRHQRGGVLAGDLSQGDAAHRQRQGLGPGDPPHAGDDGHEHRQRDHLSNGRLELPDHPSRKTSPPPDARLGRHRRHRGQYRLRLGHPCAAVCLLVTLLRGVTHPWRSAPRAGRRVVRAERGRCVTLATMVPAW